MRVCVNSNTVDFLPKIVLKFSLLVTIVVSVFNSRLSMRSITRFVPITCILAHFFPFLCCSSFGSFGKGSNWSSSEKFPSIENTALCPSRWKTLFACALPQTEQDFCGQPQTITTKKWGCCCCLGHVLLPVPVWFLVFFAGLRSSCPEPSLLEQKCSPEVRKSKIKVLPGAYSLTDLTGYTGAWQCGCLYFLAKKPRHCELKNFNYARLCNALNKGSLFYREPL